MKEHVHTIMRKRKPKASNVNSRLAYMVKTLRAVELFFAVGIYSKHTPRRKTFVSVRIWLKNEVKNLRLLQLCVE